MIQEDEINNISKIKVNENYDISIVGAGHAGIEAGLASARLGCKTIVFAINLDSVGNCPCNPSIGGTAKGHLVREIDALGGEMGRTTDECFLQSRMLNLGKGPAVHSLRAQIDRNKYKEIMKHKLELQENLYLKQAEIIDIFHDNHSKNWILTSRNGIKYASKCVILATGTFLEGVVHIGETSYQSGPDGIFPAVLLGDSLRKLGIGLRRFKTGTPARVLRSSINFEGLEEQCGDENIVPFSYDTESIGENKVKCYISWTNDKTKEVILKNIHRAPMYSGKIEGVGPRYCPSIEDKIVRFPDKKRHQMFIEPCGLNTEEMYLQGMSTSLPEEIQIEMYKTIPGLENVKIMRFAYAIEYDIADPQQMNATLEFKEHAGLFGAGQFNGSSGYEEAAAQGLVAGINAVLSLRGEEPMILPRESSYIGTMIDDLVTKGTEEPYRMMTSRSEYRLLLRQDNAADRLSDIGYRVGLVPADRYAAFCARRDRIEKEVDRVSRTSIGPSAEANRILCGAGAAPLSDGIRLSELIRRPELHYDMLAPVDPERPALEASEREAVEIRIKYAGYLRREEAEVQRQKKLEEKRLPPDLDYGRIRGLRTEAAEKLSAIRPLHVGQAARISGVNPADITVLLLYLRSNRTDTDAAEDDRRSDAGSAL